MKRKVKSQKSKVKSKGKKSKVVGVRGGAPARKKKIKKAPKKSKPGKKTVGPHKHAAIIKKTPVKPVKETKPEPVKTSKLKPGQYVTAYLSLGSNVGDREEYIEQAITLLRETPGIKVIRRASNFETEPVGKRNQAQFINSTVEISTNLQPKKLLETTQSIEDTLGRERGAEWGPRTIDIDILLYGSEIVSDDTLTVPHPLMHERMFVLEPLKEIAPHVTHPVLDRTVQELFEDMKSETTEAADEEIRGFREAKRGIADDYERW